MPGEAWDLLRISSLKTLRALQTLGKLATQLASDVSKHRYEQCTCQMSASLGVNTYEFQHCIAQTSVSIGVNRCEY
jgi:hypothetical protein